jgi:multiple sugar transport system permease protein
MRSRPSGWHLALVPIALLMAVPLIWMLVTSLSTLAETRRFPPTLPSQLEWDNYVTAWTDSPFARWMLNSTVVSVTCVLSNIVLCSLAGYAFARLRFRGSQIAFLAILATLMVPFQVVMIPTLLIVKHLGLVDTLPALILPNLVTAFGIYLMRQFFVSLPIELEEAALIDGAGRVRILAGC